jgi:hypothetical protein
MNPNVRRQIKDIQVRAERLMNGSPSIEDIEEFHRYNEELKRYLLDHLEETELRQRAYEIPTILEESDPQVAARGIVSAILSLSVSWITTYFNDRQRVENSKEAIRTARAQYASIEFFIRNA